MSVATRLLIPLVAALTPHASGLDIRTSAPTDLAERPAAMLVGDSGLQKNVVLFLVDDAILDSMEAFSRVNLYQRRIDGSFDPGGSAPSAVGFYSALPAMDRMARQGVLFSEYRAMPLCSPSRACLLTGMYPFNRHGQGTTVRRDHVWAEQFEFNAQVGFRYPVIADFIRSAGGRAGMVGKWHLAMPEGEMAVPNQNGFVGTGWSHMRRVGKWDDFVNTFGNLNEAPIPDKNGQPALGLHGTYYHYYLNNNGALEEVTNLQQESFSPPDNRSNLDRTGCATRTQAIDALAMINSYGSERFFVLVSFNTTHVPAQPAPVDMVRTPGVGTPDALWPGKSFLNFQSMVESMDVALEHVVSGMDPEIRRNTVFILAGDNGTAQKALAAFDRGITPAGGSTGDLGESYLYVLGAMDGNLPPGASPALGPKKNAARLKQTAYERGVRSNLILWDPSGEVVVNPGSESLVQVDIVDLMPTVLDLMGVPYSVDRFDGKSLLPALRGCVSRETHERQFSFSEVYFPTGVGPTVNPRNDPNFLGEWSQGMGVIPAGKIVSYHSNAVYFYRALTTTAVPPTIASHWQRLAMKQRAFIQDVRDTANPGTYKILRNYFEDANEFVDHFYRLYDASMNPVDPIEAYELDQQGAYAAEYQRVRTAFDRFLARRPPTLPD